MRKIIISILLFSTTAIKPVNSQTCFRLKGNPSFRIGDKLNTKALTINFSLDEGGNNYGKNNGLIDYISTDSILSISLPIGNIAGAIRFTIIERSQKMTSLNAFWLFALEGNIEDHRIALEQIKTNYLNSLNLKKIDFSKGGEYKIQRNGVTETFTLRPRIGSNGIDLNYGAFYYSIK